MSQAPVQKETLPVDDLRTYCHTEDGVVRPLFASAPTSCPARRSPWSEKAATKLHFQSFEEFRMRIDKHFQQLQVAVTFLLFWFCCFT